MSNSNVRRTPQEINQINARHGNGNFVYLDRFGVVQVGSIRR